MSVEAPPCLELKRLAERLWEYEPTAVLWEPDGALRAYNGEALRKAMAASLVDERAPVALYDVFRSPDNEHVIAIQATEDASHPRDLKFYCDGELMPRQEVARGETCYATAVQRVKISCPPPENAHCV